MATDTLKMARRLEKSINSHIRRKENGSPRFFDAQAQADKLMASSTAAARTAKGHSVSRSTRSR